VSSRATAELLDPGPPHARLVRAGARLAGVGATALATARRLRELRRDAPESALVHARALALRDAARRVLALHGIDAAAEGASPLGPAILAANHVSWLDPLVVAAQLPCIPVSKLDVAGWPVVGNLARELGVVFVARGDTGSGARALRDVRAALAGGACVLNFPEGTTSDGDAVLPFRAGLFGLALRAGVPVVPVAIRYHPRRLAWTGDASFLPHYLRVASARGAQVSIRFGAPIAPAAGASARALADEARAQVARLLLEDR